MVYVICPNCRTQSPAWRHCANCNAPLPKVRPRQRPPASAQAASKSRSVFMDPQWHRREQISERGIARSKTASTDRGEVAMIARVTDLEEFKKQLPHIKVKTEIPLHDSHQTTIITGRMRESEVEKVHDQSSVCSLKPGLRLRPNLEQTREASQAQPVMHSALRPTSNGQTVIVGFVDFGLDFMHRNFRQPDKPNESRILALWDQTAAPNPTPPRSREDSDSRSARGLWEKYGYGRLHTKPEIDQAIKASKDNVEDAYEKLGYAPPEDSLFQIGAHGTHVADVAVGDGKGTGVPGIAPEAEIVFVESSSQPGGPLGNSFGDSAQLLEAVKFIFDLAGDRPCVVNISLGTNGGPHDGSTLVEIALDALVSEQPNRAVVIAAGNTYGKDLHAQGQVKQSGWVDLKWQVPEKDPTPNELEIWYSGRDRLTAEVIDPKGKSLGQIAPGRQKELPAGQGKRVSVISRQHDPNNDASTINLSLDPDLASGVWTLRLHGTWVEDGEFHAWIERDETGQSRFVEPQNDDYEITNKCTLNTIACGRHTVVVGSYNATGHSLPLDNTSSSGPTRDGRLKPDISAPGESVLAACSRTLVLRNRVSGTSLAAPVVTGTIALMLSEAQRLGVSLTAEQILRILQETARKEPGEGLGWDPRKGYGRVSVKDAVEAVTALGPKKLPGK